MSEGRRRYRPTANHVLIRQDDAETMSEGGLWLPEAWYISDSIQQSRLKPLQGRVIAAGRGKQVAPGVFLPVDVQPGDVVAFRELKGAAIRDPNTREDLLLVEAEDLLAKLIETDDGMSVQCLFDQVLIRLDTAPQKTDGGLILTEAARRAVWSGEILAAGAGKPKWSKKQRTIIRRDLGDLVGFRARFEEARGLYLQLGEQKCCLVNVDDILYLEENAA